jgi:hypothetical protein
MPQPRKYASRAAQQAAYRKRQAGEQRRLLESKGLPMLPAISTIPGHVRWNAMLVQAQTLLTEAADEMQEYHDDRSEEWQDSDKAEDMLERIELFQDAAEQIQQMR